MAFAGTLGERPYGKTCLVRQSVRRQVAYAAAFEDDAEALADDVDAADAVEAAFAFCGFSKNVACTDALTLPAAFELEMRIVPTVLSAMVTESMLHGYAPFANARTTFSASATVLQL